jgi:hypothetical protein
VVEHTPVTFFGLRTPSRSAEPELLDTFFVSAVGTVLIIRIFLEATGYPRLGGEGVHIAHVLFGGLGMLVALVLLLGFLSSRTRYLAALIGGAGFGAFIDELGKFVTSDNNYFFQPTAALVYVLFVALFLSMRQMRRFRGLSARESLVNAVVLAEQLVAGELDEYDKSKALELLKNADQSDPIVPFLRQRFLSAQVGRASPSRFERLRDAVGDRYERVASTAAFRRVIVSLFVTQGVFFVLSLVAVGALIGGAAIGLGDVRDALAQASGGSTLTSWLKLVVTFIAGVLTVRGLVAMRYERLRAYRSFELAILVDLLLNQPFAFLDQGFGPALDVLVDLGFLAVLRYLKAAEHRMQERSLIAPSHVA